MVLITTLPVRLTEWRELEAISVKSSANGYEKFYWRLFAWKMGASGYGGDYGGETSVIWEALEG